MSVDRTVDEVDPSLTMKHPSINRNRILMNYLTASTLFLAIRFFAGFWGEYLEGTCQIWADNHDSTSIFEPSTVVWRGKNCDQFLICKEFVSVFDHFVTSGNQINIKFCTRHLHRGWRKLARDATATLAEQGRHPIARIGPQEITNNATWWYFCRNLDASKLV